MASRQLSIKEGALLPRLMGGGRYIYTYIAKKGHARHSPLYSFAIFQGYISVYYVYVSAVNLVVFRCQSGCFVRRDRRDVWPKKRALTVFNRV